MPLNDTLDQRAAFEPTDLPIISLYLNTQPDRRGHANFDSFLRKEFKRRARTFPLRSPARLSFDADAEHIEKFLGDELQPSSNGVAIFAYHGANRFSHTLQLDPLVDEHRFYIYSQPHLYPLTRISDQAL